MDSASGTGLGPLVTGTCAHLTGGYLAAIGVFLALCTVPFALALRLRGAGRAD